MRIDELSFPNYQDKSKLANDIGGFFVRKIDTIRSDIDAVDDAHAFHSFQPLSENDVSALILSLLRIPARWTRRQLLWLLAALTCCCLLFHEL